MRSAAKVRLLARATRRNRTVALRHALHARDVVHAAVGPVADCHDPSALEDVGMAYVLLTHVVERLEELVGDAA